MLAVEDSLRVRTVLADARPAHRSRASRHRGRRLEDRRTDRSTRRLLVGTLVALTLVLGAGRYVGIQLAERQALLDASRSIELLSGAVADPVTAQQLIRGDAEALARVDAVVRDRLLQTTSIRRVKIWSSDGRVLYSDDAAEVGDTFPPSADQLAALGSPHAVAEVTTLTAGENAEDRELGPKLLEVYAPLASADGTELLFEAYLDYGRVHDYRRGVFGSLVTLGALTLVLLAGALLLLGLANARLLRRRQRELEEWAHVAGERDRRLLARNLHDGVVQELVGAAFALDGVKSALDGGDPGQARRLLRTATSTVRESVGGVRSSIVDLYPRSLEAVGLAAALEDVVGPLRARGIGVSLVVPDACPASDRDRELAEVLVRAARELVQNVVRHAAATSAELRITWTEVSVTLTVRDDGRGADPAALLTGPEHLGLRSLADLADEHGGALAVESAPGHGTEVTMELPR